MSRPPKPVRYVKKPKCCGGRGERRAKRGVCRRTPTNQPASSEAECIEDASIDASGQIPSSKQNPWKRGRGKFVEDLAGKLQRSAVRRPAPPDVNGVGFPPGARTSACARRCGRAASTAGSWACPGGCARAY